jgi:hypothetical protein
LLLLTLYYACLQTQVPPDNEVHLAALVATNEIATGEYDADSVLSQLSLAVLEDSGWYRTNAATAEPLWWGRGQGGNFLAGYTVAPTGENVVISPYRCVRSDNLACSHDRRYKGFCSGALQPTTQILPGPLVTRVIADAALGSCISGGISQVRCLNSDDLNEHGHLSEHG